MPECPLCREPFDLGDPTCSACGGALCPRCGADVAGDADACGTCGLEQVFDCPECGMELVSGAGVCPGCDLIFARRCPSCGESLFRAPDQCPKCFQPMTHLRRALPRLLSGLAGDRVVTWVACPTCKTHFLPSLGLCPGCGLRICPGCTLVLEPEEDACPRCMTIWGMLCFKCEAIIPFGSPECSECGQAYCPACGAAVDENDTLCGACGAEMALICSACEGEVGPDDAHCPHCGESFGETTEGASA